MKTNKYDYSLKDVFILKNGVILQPTKSNRNCGNCNKSDGGDYFTICYKHDRLCSVDYHCKHFKRRKLNG